MGVQPTAYFFLRSVNGPASSALHMTLRKAILTSRLNPPLRLVTDPLLLIRAWDLATDKAMCKISFQQDAHQFDLVN